MTTTFIDLVEDQKRYLETCLISPHSVSAYRQQEFRTAVESYDLNFAEVVHREPLIVRANSTLTLSTTLGETVEITPHLCSTFQLDRFKTWIGLPDQDFQQGRFPQPPLPSDSWQHSSAPENLSEPEQKNLTTAGFAYLFGDSTQVDRYRTTIETLYAPFVATAYVIEKLTIEANACVIVQGEHPAILLISELEIIEGGCIKLFCPTNLTVQQLKKTVIH